MKYSTKLLVAFLGISLLFLGGIQAFGQEWSAEQKEVWQMEIKYWDLLKEGNLKGYMELWVVVHFSSALFSWRPISA
jgi:hypothetical protein